MLKHCIRNFGLAVNPGNLSARGDSRSAAEQNHVICPAACLEMDQLNLVAKMALNIVYIISMFSYLVL